MTANTLYEAVEPQIMWKQLLVPIFAEIVGGRSQFEVNHDYRLFFARRG